MNARCAGLTLSDVEGFSITIPSGVRVARALPSGIRVSVMQVTCCSYGDLAVSGDAKLFIMHHPDDDSAFKYYEEVRLLARRESHHEQYETLSWEKGRGMCLEILLSVLVRGARQTRDREGDKDRDGDWDKDNMKMEIGIKIER
tara:strand:- start:925 stop:1356 length:432 start_codon:yes stop_codon:yes gene_type:complete